MRNKIIVYEYLNARCDRIEEEYAQMLHNFIRKAGDYDEVDLLELAIARNRLSFIHEISADLFDLLKPG